MNTNQNLSQQLNNHYLALRQQNRQLLRDRQNRIYKELPEVEAIDNSICDLTINAALEGDTDVAALQQTIASFIERKYTILETHGYPKDYLKEIYQCNHCKDTGFIHDAECNCRKQLRVDWQYKRSNIGSTVTQYNFSNFKEEYYSPLASENQPCSPLENIRLVRQGLHRYLQEITLYLNGTPDIKGNILFTGKTGVGKTFLSNCVAKELMDMGYSVFYITAHNCFQQINDFVMNRHHFDGSSELYDTLYHTDILIIDDLGSEYINSLTRTQLYSLLNERHINHRATILSTNFTFEELKREYSERISSRIKESYWVFNIYGKDIRSLKR